MNKKFEKAEALNSKEQERLDSLNLKVKQDFSPSKLKENGYPELIKKKIDLPESIEEWDSKTLEKLSKFLVPGCELRTEIELLDSVKDSENEWYQEKYKEIKSEAFEEFKNYSSSSSFNKILIADKNIIKLLKVGLLDNQTEVITRLSSLKIENLFGMKSKEISNLSSSDKVNVLKSILAEQSSDYEFSGQIKVYISMLEDPNLPKEVKKKIDKFIYQRINELRAIKKVTGDSKSLLKTLSKRAFGQNVLDTKNELDLDPENGVEIAKKGMNIAKDALGWTAETFKKAPGPVKIGMVLFGIFASKTLLSAFNQFEKGKPETKENLSTLSKILRTVAKVTLGVGAIWAGNELYNKYAKGDSEHMNMYFSSAEAITFFGLKDTKDSHEKVNAAMDSVFYDDVMAEKSLREVEKAYSKSESSKDLVWRKMVRNTENLDNSKKYSAENAREGIGLMIRRYSPEHKDDKLSIYNKKSNDKKTKDRIAQIWEQALLKGDDWRDVLVACMAYDAEFARDNSVEAFATFQKETEAKKEYYEEVSKLEVEHGMDKIWIEGGKFFTKITYPVRLASKYTLVKIWDKIEKPTTDKGRELYNYMKKRGEEDGYIKIDDLDQYVRNLSLNGWENIPYAKKLATGLGKLGVFIKEKAHNVTDIATNNTEITSYNQFKERFIDSEEGESLTMIPKKISILSKDINLKKGEQIHMAGLNNKMIFPGTKSEFLENFSVRYRSSSPYKNIIENTPTSEKDGLIKNEHMRFHSSGKKYTLIDLPPNILITPKKDSVSLRHCTFYAQHFAYADNEKMRLKLAKLVIKHLPFAKPL